MPGEMRAGGTGAIRSGLRGCGISGKGLGHMAGEVPRGNWGRWARWGSPPLPAWGNSVPQLCAQWAPSGHCSTRGATPGSPETAPLPECSSLVLPRASCCPPHPCQPPASPTLLTHPQRPRRLCKCNLLLLLPLGQAPGLPRASVFPSVQWDTAPPTPRRMLLGSDGAGPVHPSTVP